jgi:alkanesulfonate monooxygenase SsuD/methylene tetrahydromethanopterin reductase-like flavin-dependent oxidoreductase (luciferase family)
MTRHPALLAMEIATIERLFPGRVRPGIGLGVPHWVEQMGLGTKLQLAALREAVTGVRQLLAGEEITRQGSVFTFDAVKLAHHPEAPPPIYMGVIGPNLLRLAGEVADGTIASVLASPTYVRWLRQRVAEGQAVAGREGDHHRVTALAMYSVDQQAPLAKVGLRDSTAFFLSLLPTSALAAVYGIGEELSDMCRRGGEHAAALIAREMPDQWLEDLVIAGDPDECAAKIRALLDAGADTVVLSPASLDHLEQLLELTALDVLPKVGGWRTTV